MCTGLQAARSMAPAMTTTRPQPDSGKRRLRLVLLFSALVAIAPIAQTHARAAAGSNGAEPRSANKAFTLIILSAQPHPEQTQWAQATGGDMIHDMEVSNVVWRVHAFTEVGTNTLTVLKPGDMHYLIVGGGGGGGRERSSAGGGGAGGVLTSFTNEAINVTTGTHEIVVGAGGAGPTGSTGTGSDGANSSAFGFTAIGGGGGGHREGRDGGSGGGGGYRDTTPAWPGGSGTAGQGRDGGNGAISASGQWWNEAGGGGGGFSQTGANGTTNKGGDGGFGFDARAYLGADVFGDDGWFAGGGAGAKRSENTGGSGGKGGGGSSHVGAHPTAGDANTGGGGGGSASDRNGADGGSGIVIVRYRPKTSMQVRDKSNGAIIAMDEKAVLPPTLMGQSVFRTFAATNRHSVSGNLVLTNHVAAVVFEESGETTYGGFTIFHNINGVDRTIAPGTSAGFTVQFSATELGVQTGTVKILHNDPAKEPYRFTVEAGVFDEQEALMRVYDGDRLVETNAVVSLGKRAESTIIPNRKVFTAANAAEAPTNLTLHDSPAAVVFTQSGTTNYGGFTITSNIPGNTEMGAGDSKTFTLQFATNAVGSHTATVSIRNNDPLRDPYTFDVTSTVKEDRNMPPQPIDVTPFDEILNVFDVAPAWSVHPPGSPVLITRDGFQYILYYGGDGYLAVAQRELGSESWAYHTFPVKTGWATTGHGKISMAIDRDGYVHITAYRRILAEAPPSPPSQIYYRSLAPHSVEEFERLTMRSSSQTYDYPKFIMSGDDLFFEYRAGGSGGGNYAYYAYDPDERTWSLLSGQAFLHGGGTMSPYARLDPGPDGYWHLRWVWRNNPANDSNHSASYARSEDLAKWENAAGEPLELPITGSTEGVLIDPGTTTGSGISNMHQGSLGFDSELRPILSYHKFDEEGNSQVFNARWEGDAWNIVQATDWNFRWAYHGTGTIPPVLRQGNVELGRAPGTLHHLVQSDAHGQQLITLDEETLEPLQTRPVEDPLWKQVLRQTESDFTVRQMHVVLGNDRGKSQEEGVEYIWRWERGGYNRDQGVSQPWPDPTMLRVYKIDSDI